MTVQDPTIVVQVEDDLVVFVGTPEEHVIQSDNKELIKTVKANMERVRQVALIHDMPYLLFPSGNSTFLEITAALVSANPGQSVILTAPDEVLKALTDARGEVVAGAIY